MLSINCLEIDLNDYNADENTKKTRKMSWWKQKIESMKASMSRAAERQGNMIREVITRPSYRRHSMIIFAFYLYFFFVVASLMLWIYLQEYWEFINPVIISLVTVFFIKYLEKLSPNSKMKVWEKFREEVDRNPSIRAISIIIKEPVEEYYYETKNERVMYESTNSMLRKQFKLEKDGFFITYRDGEKYFPYDSIASLHIVPIGSANRVDGRKHCINCKKPFDLCECEWKDGKLIS